MTYVYIMANRNQRIHKKKTKIGISIDPHQRLIDLAFHRLNIPGFKDIEVFGIYLYNDGDPYEAMKLETKAHRHFKKYSCNHQRFDGASELFNIAPSIAEAFLLEQGAKKIS